MSLKIQNIWEHFVEEYNENSKCNVYKYLLSIDYIPGSAKDITRSPLHRVSQSSGKMRDFQKKKTVQGNVVSPFVPALSPHIAKGSSIII